MNLISLINNKQFLSLLVGIMPLSFLIGNMAISINTILLTLIPLMIFGKEIFKIKIHLLDKIIITYFILVIITGVINNFQLYPILKTFDGDMTFKEYFLTTIKSNFFSKVLANLFYSEIFY